MRRAVAVLVVEDDRDVLDVVVDAIRDLGRLAYGAGSGPEALALLSALPRPCLVLLDMVMHPMTGPEFLEQLAARPDSGDFLVVATSATPGAVDNVAGVVATLPKPYELADLGALITQHVAAPDESASIAAGGDRSP